MQLSNSNKPIFYKERAKQKKKKGKENTAKKSKFQQYQRKTNRQKLGSIIDDAMFLERLSRNPMISLRALDPDTGEEVVDTIGEIIRGHATEAVNYFEKKTNFWEEASKMFPSKKRNRWLTLYLKYFYQLVTMVHQESTRRTSTGIG